MNRAGVRNVQIQRAPVQGEGARHRRRQRDLLRDRRKAGRHHFHRRQHLGVPQRQRQIAAERADAEGLPCRPVDGDDLAAGIEHDHRIGKPLEKFLRHFRLRCGRREFAAALCFGNA